MLSISTLIPILVIFFLFSAFFSAAEAALIALNKVRLRHMVEQKKKGARRVYGLIARMDKLIATILLGNSLVNTGIASITTYILTQYIGAGRGLVVSTLLVTVLLVLFAELTPKIIATNHPEVVSFWTRHFMSFCIFIFRPVTNLFTAASHAVIRLFGGNPHHRSPLVTEEEIKMMIQIGKEEGFYGDNERKMLERIFHFDEIQVRDVMTPIDKVTGVTLEMGQDEIERVLLEEGHNRIPVYQGDAANIIGIIYVRDLLYLIKGGTLIHLEDLMSAPFFVQPTQHVAELLKEFQRKKVQIAIVQDPKTQKSVGLVTLEDLIEEIVGEIEEVQT